MKSGEGKPDEHLSQFGQEMKERALKIHQNRSWKNRDDGGFLSGTSIWGQQIDDPAQLLVHITAVARCKNPNEFIYALSTNLVGGLFLYDQEEKKERRLFHKEGMVISDLTRHAETDQFVCSLRNANGTSFIALVETSRCDQITEGDVIDEAPFWHPKDEDTIVYQSAGVGRNKNGAPIGLSPFSIQQLNMKSQEISGILESKEYDYLLPKMNSDGELFCIRRPYEPFGKSTSFSVVLKDFFLFPFRLLKAFLAFLNFFSLTFTKQPLTTQSNQKAKEMDVEKVFLRGRMIDAYETIKNNSAKVQPDEAPLVPPDWELIKVVDGVAEVLAKSVVSYDFDDDGNSVTVGVNVLFVAQRGPAAEQNRIEVPYFLAVTNANRHILAKKLFTLVMEFEGNTVRAQTIEELTQTTPFPVGANGSAYRTFIGLQLTPKQLEDLRRERGG